MVSGRELSAPKGLLKHLILHLSSQRPISGVEVSKAIGEMSNGVWKPSPGSIYYIFSELSSKKLIEPLPTASGTEKRYMTTTRGKEERRKLAGRLIAELDREFAFLQILAEVVEDKAASSVVEFARRALAVSQSKAIPLDKVKACLDKYA